MAGAVEGLAEAGVAAHVTGHAPPAVGHAPGAVTGALDMGLDQREPSVHTHCTLVFKIGSVTCSCPGWSGWT